MPSTSIASIGRHRPFIRVLAVSLVIGVAFAVFAAAPAAVSAQGSCSGSSSMDGEAQAFLGLINSYRAQNGLGTLSVSPALTADASWMANDLGTHAYFSHTDSLGRSPWTRAADCGYGSAGGENLAAGTDRSTAQGAFQLFRNSPEHNAIMLTAEFQEIGITRAYIAGSPYLWYWATEFGRGDGAPAAAAAPAPAATAPPPPPPPAPEAPPPPPPTAAPAPPQASSAAPLSASDTAAPAQASPAPTTTGGASVDAQAVAGAAAAPTPDVPGDAPQELHIAWDAGPTDPAQLVTAHGPLAMLYWFDQASGLWLHYGAATPGLPDTLTMLYPGNTYWGIFRTPSP